MVALSKISDLEKKIKGRISIKVVVGIFVFISLIYLDLPGLYLDAVNPDYMGLHILHSDNVSEWAYSDNVIMTKIEGNEAYSHYPILNSLYGTCFEAYTMLLWSIPFGWGVYAIRTSHILYSLFLLLGIYILLKYVFEDKNVAAIGTLLLAVEPTLVFSSRTQYYIQLFPHVFFGFGLFLLMRALFETTKTTKRIVLSGILLGLSAGCYFVFAFYFVGVFIVFVLLMIVKKNSWLKRSFQLIIGFIIGYIPYIYAHISIVITQGIDGWIEAIKGLNTYGLTDGATASFLERVQHIFERVGSVSGGSSIILSMTGINIGAAWGIFLAVIYVICIVFSIVALIGMKRSFFESKEMVLLLFLDIIFALHCVLALLVGNSLGYQHFIMLLPVMYMTIFITFKRIYRDIFSGINSKSTMGRTVIGCGIIVLLVISLIKDAQGYQCIGKTGGIGYYSKVINDMGYYLDGAVEDEDTIISPQWGYWMQVACITSGEKMVWIDSDLDTLQWKIDSYQKSGRYFVIVDNNTDKEMVETLMDNNSYERTYILNFVDYGSVLSPEIWIYSICQE